MKLTYTRPHNISVLQDEIFAAIPDLQPIPHPNGLPDPHTGGIALVPVMTAISYGDEIELTVPEGTDERAIAAVVQAHDETTKHPDPVRNAANRLRVLRDIGRANWTEEQKDEMIDLIAERLVGLGLTSEQVDLVI